MSERTKQTGQARPNKPSDSSSNEDERFECYIGNIHVSELSDAVPTNVLITKIKTELDPGRGGRRIREPPFNKIPVTPLVIEDQMTLENPIWYVENGLKQPYGNNTPIAWPDAVEGIAAMMDWFENNRPQDSGRVYVSELEFVEVPTEFATFDGDRKKVDWNAIAKERLDKGQTGPRVHIGQVKRRQAPIDSEKVKSRIGSSLLNSTSKPRMLVKHKAVTVVPDYEYDRTRSKRYYSGTDSKHNNCKYYDTPEVHDFTETPLNEALRGKSAQETIREFFPSAADSPLLDVYRLLGTETSSNGFDASDASKVM